MTLALAILNKDDNAITMIFYYYFFYCFYMFLDKYMKPAVLPVDYFIVFFLSVTQSVNVVIIYKLLKITSPLFGGYEYVVILVSFIIINYQLFIKNLNYLSILSRFKKKPINKILSIILTSTYILYFLFTYYFLLTI